RLAHRALDLPRTRYARVLPRWKVPHSDARPSTQDSLRRTVNLNEYQDLTDETAIYPEAGEGSITALAYVGLGLGEVGELQGKIKKILRDDNGVLTPSRRKELIDELGDVLWYVARLARELDVSLNSVANGNAVKLASRRDRGVLGGSGDNR